MEERTFEGTDDHVLRTRASDVPPIDRHVVVCNVHVSRLRDGWHRAFQLSFARAAMLAPFGPAA